jgi:hypothetical protein
MSRLATARPYSERLIHEIDVIMWFLITNVHYRRQLLPRVPNALGEGPKTLGEEPPGMPLTGKRPSPSAKNRTFGEAFPECRPPPRGRFNTVDAVSLFLLFPECNTRGRNFLFLF